MHQTNYMRIALTLCLLMVLAGHAFSQQTETEAVKKTINILFTAMKKGDSSLLHTVFHKDMVLHIVSSKKDGSKVLAADSSAGFLKAVGTPHTEVWDERITFGDIKIDDNLASVWTPYKFYLSDKFSHCGVNFFQLMKTADGWKVIYIVDTRRRDNCPE
ncbi:nuclear transport factor 2 family protein [Mucilaginibacter sp. UR6-1]|uniref:nuclear transport factor 2 family protein n=1 Tax=Mucilaginibacter sp. UR6-1 TaxID=1435643 RepID=UPI001E393F01|nr:nuclear transport factor 2 family protein [Mucilaginibacter sp. UR6-1]MCC8410311.1 nuclear transport factor 2 family protein [Mucilaginibacter sp. UR6-1]